MCAQGAANAPPGETECEIIFVDLLQASSALEAEESTTPRLSSIERDRFMSRSTSDPRAAQTWRLSRIALRIVLERWAGNDIRQSTFEIEHGGRPRLLSGCPHFSLSHTGDVALIAISKHSAIGIDIEQERTLNMSDVRRSKLISAAMLLAALNEAGSTHLVKNLDDHSVLKAWVQLEAVAKASGMGIGRLLTDLSAKSSADDNEILVEPLVGHRLCVRDIDVGPRYFAATAAVALPDTLHVNHFPHTTSNIASFCQAQPHTDLA